MAASSSDSAAEPEGAAAAASAAAPGREVSFAHGASGMSGTTCTGPGHVKEGGVGKAQALRGVGMSVCWGGGGGGGVG